MVSSIQGKNSNRVKSDALKLSAKTVHLEVQLVNSHLNLPTIKNKRKGVHNESGILFQTWDLC